MGYQPIETARGPIRTIAKRIPDRVMELSLGILFVIVAGLTIGEVIL